MGTTSLKDNTGKNYIAFFDLDRTVISANSGKLLIQYAFKNRLITIWDILRGAYASLLYRFNLRDTTKIINSLVSWLKGVPETALTALSAEMFNDRLIKTIRPEIREKIRFHKMEGARVVLLSSAIWPVCRQVSDYLDMDDFVCSELEVKNGICTGLPLGSLCFGKEKASRLTEYCKNNGSYPESSWYYGDSIDDLPVMKSVGKPVCVYPDKRLLIEARKNGWEVFSPKKPF
jgi:HAD superfamily hydrolase (TIGR01490 family)